MTKRILLSVHQLVDFLLRTGDIDNRVFNKATMSEGTRIHSYYQSKQGKNYLSEYLLCQTFKVDGFEITLEGRADGIIIGNEKAIIDEIKSTISPLDDFYNEQKEWHLGQAKCYALMYAMEKNLDAIDIQLTYINQLDDSKMTKSFSFFTNELKTDIEKLLKEYIAFYKIIFKRTEKRNESAKTLAFPYKSFREGQKELAKYAYGVAQKGGILFAEAPTGIGKTISTLYPFAKSFANEENDKIFYLTAKNSGKEMAFDATKLMIEKGLVASAISISAKDKVCFCPGKACNPDECPFAKGYYTKLKRVLTESITSNNLFSQKEISEIARHNAICPFELSLDISLFVDIIICDYNYFFDPLVYLKRYFDGDASKYLVLVDEAHNLVERGRNMYSASFDSFRFKQVKKSLKNFEHKKMQNAIKRITKLFNKYKDFLDGDTKIEELTKTDINSINSYLLAATDINKHHHSVVTNEFAEFFFDLNKFFKLLDYYDSTFNLFISKKDKNHIKICLYCVDPREHLKRCLNMVKGKVIFSATLSPSDYYIDMIGGDKLDPILFLPSPFEKDNLCLMVAPKVSVRYKNRSETIEEVASYIHELVKGKLGNYFIYTPSYEYLESLVPYLDEDYDLIIQSKDMSEEDKSSFLTCFVDNPKRTTVGLAVLGGAFSEGIDLVGERIIGVVVIGVGLPQICYERDIIKEYFDKEHKGYDYAYVAPGMNKVMQAVGRVIRSETDKGVALLIDDRYLTDTYLDMFKNSWSNYNVVTTKEDIKEIIDNFWKKN